MSDGGIITQTQIEHLKLIQAVITRMAGNSFLIKGWTVTLVAGLSAFAKADADRTFAWIAVAVVVVFCLLDAFYLALERAYRALYRSVAEGSSSVSPWTLEASSVGPKEILAALAGFAVWPLYGTALAGSLAVAYFL